MANGLLDLLGGAIGTTPPAYLEGLLGQNAVEDLRKRSIGSGLVNALVGYAAMPKNQNLGLGRILAGAAQAGMQGAQGVYDTATQDYMMQQKIAEMQRQKEQQLARESAIGQLPAEQQALYRAYGEAAVPKLVESAMPKPKELKALPTYEVQQGRTKLTVQVQPDGTEKIIGRGSMDAPQKPTTESVSYKTETDAQGNLVYVPNKPNYAVVDASGKPVIGYKPAAAAKMTEDQAKASGWLSQATNAYNNMIKAAGAESPNLLESGLSAIGLEGAANLARSAPRQQFVQATKSLSEALLRAATGAGVNKDEAVQKVEELTPLWTDKPETRQQKLDAIPVYLEALRVRAGSGAKAVAPPVDKINIIPSGTLMPSSPSTGNRDKAAILKQYGL